MNDEHLTNSRRSIEYRRYNETSIAVTGRPVHSHASRATFRN
ncbi:hypothetical protein VDGL01_12556 [Verticillium dahliae]